MRRSRQMARAGIELATPRFSVVDRGATAGHGRRRPAKISLQIASIAAIATCGPFRVTPRLCGLVDARWTSGELAPPGSARMPTTPGRVSQPWESGTLSESQRERCNHACCLAWGGDVRARGEGRAFGPAVLAARLRADGFHPNVSRRTRLSAVPLHRPRPCSLATGLQRLP
jgi:hypothetical protein